MPFASENARKTPGKAAADLFESWNRKLHYYLGLYFLFFLWLFSFSGLLLNHGEWKFAEFWPSRVETVREQSVPAAAQVTAQERAGLVMKHLGLRGEINWPNRQDRADMLVFQVARPGTNYQVTVDIPGNRAVIKETRLNGWGVLHVLHTFSGVRRGMPAMSRDWIMTEVWVLSMDAFAIGLLIMVFGSYFMWFRMKAKRRIGALCLAAGIVCCGVFVAGAAAFR